MLRGKYYLLTYNYVPDMLKKRTPHRDTHIAYAIAFESKGLLLGGALQNPIDSGILLFYSDESTVRAYAENDPYFKNNLITSYSIREIMLAFGSIKPKI